MLNADYRGVSKVSCGTSYCKILWRMYRIENKIGSLLQSRSEIFNFSFIFFSLFFYFEVWSGFPVLSDNHLYVPTESCEEKGQLWKEQRTQGTTASFKERKCCKQQSIEVEGFSAMMKTKIVYAKYSP